MSLDIERADNMYRRGRIADLTVGPFSFSVNTADAGQVGFCITIGRWEIGWFWQGRERP